MNSIANNILSPIQEPAAKPSARPDEAPAQGAGPSFGSVLAARVALRAGKAARGADLGPGADVAPAADEVFASPEVSDLTPSEPLKSPVALVNVLNARPVETSVAPTVADDTQDAWSEFLGQMDEQLNVKPADVLAAFETLSDDDLNAAPADTTDQMVAAMGLTGQGALLAKQLLNKLIVRTEKPVETNATEQNPVADLRAAGNLVSTLDQMSARQMFAPVAPAAPKADRAGAGADATTGTEAKNALADLTPSTDENAPAEAKAAPVDTAPTPPMPQVLAQAEPKTSDAVPRRTPAEAVTALVEKMQAVRSEDRPRVDRLVQDIIDGTRTARPPVMTPLANQAEATVDEAPEFEAPTPKFSNKASDDLFANAKKQSTEDASEEQTDDDAELGAEFNQSGDARLAQGTSSTKSTDFARTLESNVNGTAPTAPTVPNDVVENARLMVNKGGGEMKVTVNSEVGEVAMNVSVKDGKVSVEMLAETDEAKRMLESQLGDLKTHLAAHALQIDKINVDTNSNLGQQQGERQSANDQHRQPAQQNWNQFDQRGGGQQSQNQARRQMYDGASDRGYGTSVARRGMPAPVAPPNRTDNSRRLNLVA